MRCACPARLDAWLLAGAVALFAARVAQAQPSSPSHRKEGGEGIWKAVVPPVAMKGEFDDFDPLGVAAGARIKADCSLNWIDPDDGKLYCFSSGTSLQVFLDAPRANIARARAGWRKLKPTG